MGSAGRRDGRGAVMAASAVARGVRDAGGRPGSGAVGDRADLVDHCRALGGHRGPPRRRRPYAAARREGAHRCGRLCAGLRGGAHRPRAEGPVRVRLTLSSPSGDRRSGCTKERSATARVRLPVPLGREVVVDHDVQFTADGAKAAALRLCGKLGCTPPATGCTDASYDQALMAVDAPTHSSRDSQECDGKWLVLDFPWRTGPVCDDASEPGCSSRLGDRWFYRAEKSGGCRSSRGRRGLPGRAAHRPFRPGRARGSLRFLPPCTRVIRPRPPPRARPPRRAAPGARAGTPAGSR